MREIISEEKDKKVSTLNKRIGELDSLALREKISNIGFEVCLAVAAFDAGVISYSGILKSYKQTKRRAR